MASNSPRTQLFPGVLFDRLTVSATASTVDSLHRELTSLLNATALTSSRDLSRWPLVSRSVLNFGVPGFTGRMLTNADIPEIERNITRAIQQFEPRLDPKTVQVTVMTAQTEAAAAQGWRVRIVAQRRDESERPHVEVWAVVDAQSGHLQMSD